MNFDFKGARKFEFKDYEGSRIEISKKIRCQSLNSDDLKAKFLPILGI